MGGGRAQNGARISIEGSAAHGFKLSWLAAMQHYGAPTRLLDFTYSPYVALYFALRNRNDNEAESDAEVWAINAAAVKASAMEVSREADDKIREHEGTPVSTFGR